MKLSIFSKLTSVILVLMLLAVVPITQKTAAIFEAAARRSAEEINLNSSLNVAREVETFFISTNIALMIKLLEILYLFMC
jgi:hypothetical protein